MKTFIGSKAVLKKRKPYKENSYLKMKKMKITYFNEIFFICK